MPIYAVRNVRKSPEEESSAEGIFYAETPGELFCLIDETVDPFIFEYKVLEDDDRGGLIVYQKGPENSMFNKREKTEVEFTEGLANHLDSGLILNEILDEITSGEDGRSVEQEKELYLAGREVEREEWMPMCNPYANEIRDNLDEKKREARKNIKLVKK